MHVLLIIAAILLPAAFVLQDYLVPNLRQSTISAGLTGPYHWIIDATDVLIAVALAGSFWPPQSLATMAALVAAGALVLTAATNTFGTVIDASAKDPGLHSELHSIFTICVFVSMLVVECFTNHSPAMWMLTVSGACVAGLVYWLSERSDYAEKAAVLGLCFWLIAWAL